MKQHFYRFATLSFAVLLFSCNGNNNQTAESTPSYKEENITYNGDSVTMHGFVVYNENDSSKRPAVLVVHEWWGLNDYPKMRAMELAKLGYVAMAVDMYGNGLQADNPDSAGKYSTPFYENPTMAKARLDAAIEKLKTYPQVDANKIGAIGYCFGGGVLLNSERLGEPALKGIVSFHGSMPAVPANKELLQTKTLVCHGADDQFVSMADVEKFKQQMDSINAGYTVKIYDNATHAFTNPGATAAGEKFHIPIAYNAAADSSSWNDMKAFFANVFK